MIYSNTLFSSNTDYALDIEANPKYYGAGAFNFMQECAKDELEIFENAITTDMNEVVLGESSYEMEAINEGFFENILKKFKEIFKKFIEWIKAVIRSAIAKLASLLIRDNKEFAKFARKRLNDPRAKKYEYTGLHLKVSETLDFIKTFDDIKNQANDLKETANNLNKNSITRFDEESVKDAQNDYDGMNSLTVSDTMDKITDTGTINIDDIKKHLDVLEKLGKQDIKKVRDNLNTAEKNASFLIKKVEELERDLKKEKIIEGCILLEGDMRKLKRDAKKINDAKQAKEKEEFISKYRNDRAIGGRSYSVTPIPSKSSEEKDDNKTILNRSNYKDDSMPKVTGSRSYNKSSSSADDKKVDLKQCLQCALQTANLQKSMIQSQSTFTLSLIKSIARVARTVVAKGAGATVKEEYEGYDSELIDAMNEAVLFEYDEALEEMSVVL